MLTMIKFMLILCASSLSIGIIFRKRIENTIPISVMMIVLVEYISGYFGNLKIGYITTFIFIFLVSIYAFSIYIKDRKIINEVLSPYVLYYFIFIAWMFVRYSNKMFSEWDEFTHWGFTTKIMYDSDKFSNFIGSTLYFVDYLPGNALFQYFFLQLGGCFREDYTIIAQGIYTFSFLIPILGELKVCKNHLIQSIPIIFLIFIIPIGFYPTAYSSLYVDQTLSVIFGYAIFQGLKNKTSDVYFGFTMSLALGTLCITKPSGIGLMVIIAIILFADNIVVGKYKGFIHNKSYIKLILDLIPFLIGYVYKKLWAMRLEQLNYQDHFDTEQITLAKIFRVFRGEGEEYQSQTLHNFWNRYVGVDTTSFNMSALIWYILLFVILVYLIYKITGEHSRRYGYVLITSSLSYILYSVYMLFLYLFTYSPSEAVALASFERYEYTIILGIIIYLIGLLIHNMCNCEKFRSLDFMIVFIVVIFIVPCNISLSLTNEQDVNNSINMRKNYMFGEQVRASLTDRDKVYVISQGSDGLDYFIMRYTLSPVHTQVRLNNGPWNDVSWNIGQDNGKGLCRRVITQSEWMEFLNAEEFNYVLLYKIDEQFIQEFGSLFNQIPNNNQLYKVNHVNNRLEYVDLE